MTVARKWNATWGTEDGIAVDVTEYPHFDDKLDFAGSNAIVRNSETGEWIAVVDINERDEFQVRYCEHCEEFGFKNKLGVKIKKHGELPQPDDDQWVSCYGCGNTYPLYETFTESKIKDSVETTNNPFENESIFLTTETRKEQSRKGKKRKGRLSMQEDEGPDIQREIQQHGESNVHVIQ